HKYIGLAICIAFIFNAVQTKAQLGYIEELALESDTLHEKVEVAFRSIDKNDILGGISVIDVEALTEKAYTTYSLNFVETMIGGVNGNIWGMDEYLVVIDGMVRDANNVLPSEIEHITVLKG